MKSHAIKMELVRCIINNDNPSVLIKVMRIFNDEHPYFTEILANEPEVEQMHHCAEENDQCERSGYDEFI